MPEMSFDKLHTIEPAYLPKSKLGFLIDWLITLKCNYDCSYCPISEFGHDNSIPHPEYEKSLRMLKQLYAYTDVMMMSKKDRFKDAIMNIYGGEAIYHPQFVEIAEATTREFEMYKDRWRLRRRITTNATATEKNWKKIIEHVEGATMSYHTQGPEKLKTLFKKNLDYMVSTGKNYDVVVLMFPEDPYWKECCEMVRHCKENNFVVRPRLLDGDKGAYKERHLNDLAEFLDKEELNNINPSPIQQQVRACCGGRPLCTNREISENQILVPRGPEGYRGWNCSANQFFIYGDNTKGRYFTNKDCRVRLDGTTGTVATLDTMDEYTAMIRKQITENKAPPLLTCAQSTCRCGTCAPKSIHKEKLLEVMNIYNN